LMKICTQKVEVKCSSNKKDKAVPLQAWSGPEGSWNLRFSDFMTTAQDGGKFFSLTHRPPLSPGNIPGTHLCYRLIRPQDHSGTGRIMSLKTSNDTIGNRTRDQMFFKSLCKITEEVTLWVFVIKQFFKMKAKFGQWQSIYNRKIQIITNCGHIFWMIP